MIGRVATSCGDHRADLSGSLARDITTVSRDWDYIFLLRNAYAFLVLFRYINGLPTIFSSFLLQLINMASTMAAEATIAPHSLASPSNLTEYSKPQITQKKGRDVLTNFNYYKDPGDGSLPSPSYVGKPETYEQPTESKQKLVHDIRGEEDKYSLDSTGFQVLQHASSEKDFQDDAQIKETYYPEIEQILKDACVHTISLTDFWITQAR